MTAKNTVVGARPLDPHLFQRGSKIDCRSMIQDQQSQFQQDMLQKVNAAIILNKLHIGYYSSKNES